MSSTQPELLDASRVRRLYWGLIGGLLVIMGIFASLFWLKTAPILQDDQAPVIGVLMGVAALGSLLFGWMWARPKVPLRAPGMSPKLYWDDPNSGARALLLWVLWEGGTLIATVGTLVTGSPMTEAVAAAGLALLLTHSPGLLEARD